MMSGLVPPSPIARNQWFAAKWQWLRHMGLIALAGLASASCGAVMDVPVLLFLGVAAIFPLVILMAAVPVLHWKERYIGEHSTGWGLWLTLETSGWSKLVYWFRHVLPDWHRRGRYSDAA